MRERGIRPAIIGTLLLAGCASGPSPEDLEVARNTFACDLAGERLVVRFQSDEARLLMPGGDRVTLYRLPSGSGVRYSNGTLELQALSDCAPYTPPPAR